MSTPNVPNLGSIITDPSTRKRIYGTYGVFAFIVACVQVGWSASGAGPVVWLTVTLAVTAFVGTAVAGLAVTNTASTPPSTPGDHAAI